MAFNPNRAFGGAGGAESRQGRERLMDRMKGAAAPGRRRNLPTGRLPNTPLPGQASRIPQGGFGGSGSGPGAGLSSMGSGQGAASQAGNASGLSLPGQSGGGMSPDQAAAQEQTRLSASGLSTTGSGQAAASGGRGTGGDPMSERLGTTYDSPIGTEAQDVTFTQEEPPESMEDATKTSEEREAEASGGGQLYQDLLSMYGEEGLAGAQEATRGDIAAMGRRASEAGSGTMGGGYWGGQAAVAGAGAKALMDVREQYKGKKAALMDDYLKFQRGELSAEAERDFLEAMQSGRFGQEFSMEELRMSASGSIDPATGEPTSGTELDTGRGGSGATSTGGSGTSVYEDEDAETSGLQGGKG